MTGSSKLKVIANRERVLLPRDHRVSALSPSRDDKAQTSIWTRFPTSTVDWRTLLPAEREGKLLRTKRIFDRRAKPEPHRGEKQGNVREKTQRMRELNTSKIRRIQEREGTFHYIGSNTADVLRPFSVSGMAFRAWLISAVFTCHNSNNTW